MNQDNLCAIVEAIIFASDVPLSLEKMKKKIDKNMSSKDLYEAISLIQKNYERDHHGIRLSEVAEGYQFRTKLRFARYLQSQSRSSSFSLSGVALEVLAIVAYRQPIGRGEVDQIRGVDSAHVIRLLMDKKLIRIKGQSKAPGRPNTYVTTQEFLGLFNLASLDDLPSEKELSEVAASEAHSSLKIQEALKEEDSAVHPGEILFDDEKELNELDKIIKNTSSETILTESLKKEDPGAISDILDRHLQK